MIRSGTHRRVLRVVSLTLGIGVTAVAEVVAEVTVGAGAGAGGIDVFNAKLKTFVKMFLYSNNRIGMQQVSKSQIFTSLTC